MQESARLASVPRLTLSTCTVDVETSPERVTVTIAGELDMADADQVGEIIANAADAGKPMVRLRLDDLKFADSSAIKAILIGAKAADDRGIGYELVNPRGLVQRLLEVTGLTMALAVVQETQPDPGSNSH
jgi:anti-sigma B factor antagonist